MSEFLILTSTFARAPVLAITLGLGLLVALGALLYRLNGLAFGEAHGGEAPAKASFVPMFTQLGLVFVAGVYLPAPLVVWFQHIAELLR
jgi:hydrogenase-4 component F